MKKDDLKLILKIAQTSLEHLQSEKILKKELGLDEPEIVRIYEIILSMTEEA